MSFVKDSSIDLWRLEYDIFHTIYVFKEDPRIVVKIPNDLEIDGHSKYPIVWTFNKIKISELEDCHPLYDVKLDMIRLYSFKLTEF